MRKKYKMKIFTKTDKKPILGISHGDINGINYEIILKVFEDKRILEMFSVILYGTSRALNFYKEKLKLTHIGFQTIQKVQQSRPNRFNLIEIGGYETKIEPGLSKKESGKLAIEALKRAVSDLDKRNIDALVTAPIDKKNVQSDQFKYAGHTKYLSDIFNAKDHLMLLVSNDLRIGVVTGHIPLNKVSASLTQELILSKIRVLNHSLYYDFGIRKPKIAILALNPHASDQGLIGKEEKEIIIPAIEKAKENKILAMGPYPADGFFASSNYKKFDGILAMYHDQGLIPFKAISFEDGVNFTAGLPVVRTSPAHGTAFDIAGKNAANEKSLRQSLYLAADIVRNREEYEFYSKNQLKSKQAIDQNNDEDLSVLPETNGEVGEGLSI
jgi:4-hydroxythreonine-4-phosphate dehydrogenase